MLAGQLVASQLHSQTCGHGWMYGFPLSYIKMTEPGSAGIFGLCLAGWPSGLVCIWQGCLALLHLRFVCGWHRLRLCLTSWIIQKSDTCKRDGCLPTQRSLTSQRCAALDHGFLRTMRPAGEFHKSQLLSMNSACLPRQGAGTCRPRRARSFTLPSASNLTAIRDLVEADKVRPHVATVLPLAEISRSFELSEGGRTRGKIVLQVIG